LETEPALPDKDPAQDAAQATVLDKVAQAALAVVVLAAADEAVVLGAVLELHQSWNAPGWRTRPERCKLPCKASQNVWKR
jgi:hypothetical protein